MGSCPPELEVHLKKMEYSGEYYFRSKVWYQCLREKVKMVIEAIEGNQGDVIIVADIDIQFFGEIERYILDMIGDKDVLFQAESFYINSSATAVNPGFTAIRCNERTRAFWEKIYSAPLEDLPFSDMSYVNDLLKKEDVAVKWGVFDSRVWAFSQSMYRLDPYKVIVHHANCAGSLEEKMRQLRRIRRKVEFYRRSRGAYVIFLAEKALWTAYHIIFGLILLKIAKLILRKRSPW